MKDAYDRSSVMCWLLARGLISREIGRWRLEDFHPFLERQTDGTPVTSENIGFFKGLVTDEMSVSARDVKVVEEN